MRANDKMPKTIEEQVVEEIRARGLGREVYYDYPGTVSIDAGTLTAPRWFMTSGWVNETWTIDLTDLSGSVFQTWDTKIPNGCADVQRIADAILAVIKEWEDDRTSACPAK